MFCATTQRFCYAMLAKDLGQFTEANIVYGFRGLKILET